MLVLFLLTSQFAAADDLAPRLDVLRQHLARLKAVTVPKSLADDRAARLANLETLLENGAASETEFNEIYLEMDEVRQWLWANAAERPEMPQGAFADEEDSWHIGNNAIALSVSKSDMSMTVTTPAYTWRFEPSNEADIETQEGSFSLLDAASRSAEAFNTGYSIGMTMSFGEFKAAPGFGLSITANLVGNEAVFEIAAQDMHAPLKTLNWPKPIVLDNGETDCSVIPFMQGMLLPGNWPQDIHNKDLVNSRWLYMPWWGQLHGRSGVQTILETSNDAGGAYDHPSGGPTRIQPIWYASLGAFGYTRVVRYVFDDDATYVSMAKRYRRHVQETGRFVSLREKLARTPALDQVIGKPVVHLGALYHFVQEASLFNKERIEANHSLRTFAELADGLRGLKAKGVESAYVHLDGWGFYGYDNGHPDVLPPGEEQGGWDGLRAFADTCDEIGYLFAVHDQYRDFYFNAVSFDDRLAATRQDGSREEHATWCGGPQTILSPCFAPGYVRRNHDLFAQHGIKVRGAYLDVFAVVPLEESFQPAHPMTRTDCALYRRHCFDLLRARGYVVSSEEPADYLVQSLDLVHHGPYSAFGDRKEMGVSAPLFNLVYHDSILLPWSMTDKGGWGIPENDSGQLHCLLNAGLPYVNPGADNEAIAQVKEAAELARRCGMQEMVSHEFLDGSWRKQRTAFSDGTRVTVDLDTSQYEIHYGDR